MTNWLDNVDEKAMRNFAHIYYDIFKFNSVKKATHPKYGTYFTFCGWENGTNKYINPIYLGQFGPLYSKGGYLSPMENLREDVGDDFTALLHATGDLKHAYLKWIEMIAKANEDVFDEESNSYIEALEESIVRHIEETKKQLDAQTTRIIKERKSQAVDLLGDLEAKGLYDQELNNGSWDRPNRFGKRPQSESSSEYEEDEDILSK